MAAPAVGLRVLSLISQGLGDVMVRGAVADYATSQGPLFELAKFRPATLPSTLVTRSVLFERLTAGAGQRLTVVVGPAGAGKSVLLSSWAATRSPRCTSWLSCSEADADPARFWVGFTEAVRSVAPGFGAYATDRLGMDGVTSADITASIANDAAKLPEGSAIIVDDFHYAAAAASRGMTDLVERWPAETVQLVLAGRFDPPLRLQRLRMAGELCEVRGRDLYFTLAESRSLLARFGVEIADADLAVLHQRSEGWAAALQMAALSLRGTTDPARAARALDIRSHAIAEYFIAEVLEQQAPEVARFMLETSVLEELTADACAAITRRQDATALLHSLDAANLFVVALDDERTSYRYHPLVRQALRSELRARDLARALALQSRAAEWFESAGDTRCAARHFLAAQQSDRALDLLQDQVVTDFLANPGAPVPLDLSMVDSSVLAEAPDRMLAVAADLLVSGDTARGGEYLDMLERARPSVPPESKLAARFAAMRALYDALTGQADEALAEGLAARAIQERGQIADDWNAAVPMILIHIYTWLEDFQAVEREAAAALAMPELTAPAKLVHVQGARALAWFEAGYLAEAADAASTADADARQLGFGQHFFAIEHLRALAGLALERRDLDTAERLTEQALSISELGRPVFEFLALLDRAGIWAARGRVRDALATVEAARLILAGTRSVLLARADELEALLRLSLGDLRSPVELASGLPPAHRSLLLARIALAAGDHRAAQEHLQTRSLDGLSLRHALVRRILMAAAAIKRGDPMAGSILAGALQAARRGGFLNTVVTTAPEVTRYLVEHSTHVRPDPFMEQVISAALEERAAQPDAAPARRVLIEPLTAAETRILKLLPTCTHLQTAAILYISRNTVKTHVRSIYQKLGVKSRSEAIERAVELRLL
jgi:LuxR family transcriptional regulator, maltose regulon positive regulatory protein